MAISSKMSLIKVPRTYLADGIYRVVDNDCFSLCVECGGQFQRVKFPVSARLNSAAVCLQPKQNKECMCSAIMFQIKRHAATILADHAIEADVIVNIHGIIRRWIDRYTSVL